MAHLLSQPDLLQQTTHLQKQMAQQMQRQHTFHPQQQQAHHAAQQPLATGQQPLATGQQQQRTLVTNTAISTAVSAVTTVPVVSGAAAVVGATGGGATVNNLNVSVFFFASRIY